MEALKYSVESDLILYVKNASRLHESTDLAELGVLGASSGAPGECYKAPKPWYLLCLRGVQKNEDFFLRNLIFFEFL